jgi:hypothetical protein
MDTTLTPEMALDPESLAGCYRGALALDDEDDQLVASYAVLMTGRLGLRPGELLHAHEGWIDWEAGTLVVPAHDACACKLCWERARVAQRDGDPRPLATIVETDQWAGTPRAIPFGWSPRLTGALATAVDAWDYLDRSAAAIRSLLVASAKQTATLDDSPTVDPAPVSLGAMRASAAVFGARAGLDATRVADMLGISLETARSFTAREPRPAGRQLAQAVDAESPPPTATVETAPLVGSTDRFPQEPFDPATFDADWRAERAATADPPEASPRPAVGPGGGPTDATDAPDDRATATESSPVESAEAAAGAEGPPATTDDLADLVTPPVELVVHTRFASPSMDRGRACGGRLLVGQAELVMAAHGGGEITAVETVPFAAVRDVAVDWAPDHLAEVFGPTLGLAIERDGERHNAVVELPEDERPALSRALFQGLLGTVTATVRHPATVGGRVTDADQQRCVLDLGEDAIELSPSPEADPEATLALADVVAVDRDASALDGPISQAITVEYLTDDGDRATSALAPVDDRELTLLYHFLVAECRQRERQAAAADLPDSGQTVLDALQSTSGQRDLVTLLGIERRTLDDLVASLAADGFVHDTADGVRLTGLGHRCAREQPDFDA